jgi:hypothetical protein
MPSTSLRPLGVVDQPRYLMPSYPDALSRVATRKANLRGELSVLETGIEFHLIGPELTTRRWSIERNTGTFGYEEITSPLESTDTVVPPSATDAMSSS